MNEPGHALMILAAGSSSRMGNPKQLMPWGRDTLLQHTIHQAVASHFELVFVVLGAHVAAIQKTIPSHIATVTNTDWQKGMGSSIACGIRFLEAQKRAYASVLLLLGDQPLIDTAYLNVMLSTFQKEPERIVATDYGGTPGVPALFNASYFEALKNMKAQGGAQELLRKERDRVVLMNAGMATADIDTEADYIRLKAIYKNN